MTKVTVKKGTLNDTIVIETSDQTLNWTARVENCGKAYAVYDENNNEITQVPTSSNYGYRAIAEVAIKQIFANRP